MWVLLFIVLVPVSGLDKIHLLETYPSKEGCLSELERVMGEMEKAYPDDTSWTLQCRPAGKGV